MTDTTELAQREKFEAWAEHACAAPWGYLKKRRTSAGYSEQIYTCMWTAWKAANAELVEALEKAKTERDEFRRRFNLERSILEDADKDLETLRQRIAELESRTVTVKLPPRVDSSNVPFAAHTWNYCLDEVEGRLTAQGIKWEGA